MEIVTYSLKGQKENSSGFYRDLKTFTDSILNKDKYDVSWEVNPYIHFLNHHKKEKVRSYEAYFLEFLMMGVLLNEYGARVFNSGKLFRNILINLFRLRKKYPRLKDYIDIIRGYLSTLFLTKEGRKKDIQSKKDFRTFIHWLQATGEYEQEAERFLGWYAFFQEMSYAEFLSYMKLASKTGHIFKMDASNVLAKYTHNVQKFRKTILPDQVYKENYLFCGKQEVEYHLNMVGAEILNRDLRNEYQKTKNKILLLPTCMSNPEKGVCKSISLDNKKYCTGCSENCNVNKYRKYCLDRNIKINLIPHSSSFSKYLKEWENQEDTALIGVACVLNLLKGGYEMQNLNIPSQCIFLDYCGCKKHWHKKGLPTDLNIKMLDQINKPILNNQVKSMV